MESHQRVSVVVTGLRGIPDVQGGIETHVRMLYPLLARLGCDIEVIQRSPYFPKQTRKRLYHGVRLKYIWAPKIQVVETAIHTLVAVLYAAIKRPDLLHIHGIGPAFVTPVARLLGLRVVVTHHTFDYRREKWGKLSQAIFRAGERLGMKFADAVIVVSKDIREHVSREYGVDTTVVPNGARMPVKASTSTKLDRFRLVPSKYVLCVARLEATKRHQDLITAFERAETLDWKLALVGGLEPRDSYTDQIISRANNNSNIVLTDFQSGLTLREIYSHAALFVLCSSHEGQPIALLEALSYGIPSLATNIPANLTVPLPEGRYFSVGDVGSLAGLIESDVAGGAENCNWNSVREEIRANFNWKAGARHTYALYKKVLGQPPD